MADAGQSANIHASCVAIGRSGVLLLGKSGSGKSDLALRLIDDGAVLVADDRTILSVEKGALYARAPASIAGLMEVRGLGIIRFPRRAKVRIALAVQLGREGARLPGPRFYRPPARLKPQIPVPEILLEAWPAATPAKIRAALAAFARDLFRDTFNPK
ncbi:MAG TPA: HPr kinase/phosphatase C-terminal domain-containing protein [Rhizomicrobium sp.]|nr:HPr kinase/phosphatase C-terminal domain-containing protein [Rhizomicrobium sp.]